MPGMSAMRSWTKAGSLSSKLRRRAEGQSLVEFVLVLPLLLVLVFGIIEFGNLWRQYQIVTNAAREGARTAILPSTSDSEVTTVLDNYLTNAGLQPGEATYIYNDGSGLCSGASCTGDAEAVRVEYPFEFSVFSGVINLITAGSGSNYGTITMRTESVMRHE